MSKQCFQRENENTDIKKYKYGMTKKNLSYMHIARSAWQI